MDAASTVATAAEARSYAVERSFLVVGDQRWALHLPKGREAPVPSVLVFHSAMGRTESVLEWCDRLAERGLAAIALDFYDGRTATSPDEGLRLRDSANERSALLKRMVEQAWTALQTDDRLRATRRFLLGWSYGGAWATVSSGFLPDITGIVALYGQAFTDDVNLYTTLEAPVLFIGGANDRTPPPATLQRVVEELRAKGKPADLLLVPAGHGFAERSHPGYDPDAARQARDEAIEFLASRSGG